MNDPKAKYKIAVGCETCSAGSSEDILIELDEDGFFGFEFECDNCNSQFTVAIFPASDKEIQPIEVDE